MNESAVKLNIYAEMSVFVFMLAVNILRQNRRKYYDIFASTETTAIVTTKRHQYNNAAICWYTFTQPNINNVEIRIKAARREGGATYLWAK